MFLERDFAGVTMLQKVKYALKLVFARCGNGVWSSIKTAKRAWIILGVLCIGLLFFILSQVDFGCSAILDKTQLLDRQKILSYRFTLGATKYLENFKCLATFMDDKNGCHETPGAKDDLPTIVTAASANHFEESMSMLRTLNQGLRKNYTGIHVVYFDLGLNETQIPQIKEQCEPNCEVVPFPFEKFPPHVRHMRGYAWKPLAIQLVLDRTKFVIWMDTSIDIITMDLKAVLEKAKSNNILFYHQWGGSIARRTGKFLFDSLDEQPCLYQGNEVPTGFLVFYWDRTLSTYIMEPWLACALSVNCVVPENDYESYILCLPDEMAFHSCHRFEQSALGVIVNRYHNGNLEGNLLDNAGVKYNIIRGPR